MGYEPLIEERLEILELLRSRFLRSSRCRRRLLLSRCLLLGLVVQRLRGKLDEAAVPVHAVGDTSLYFAGPDGERLELISDPLGEMYGSDVL